MPPADPAEVVELLHRQLMELEVLEAMYPREGDAGVEVLNPTAAEAARAAVDAWESSGEPPTDAVLRAIPSLRAALTLHVPGGDGDDRGAVTLRATLPHGYPHEAPALELSASILPPRRQRLTSSKSSARSPTNAPPPCATTARSV